MNVEGLRTLPPSLCLRSLVCLYYWLLYSPLPSSVLIIDDLFFLSVFFSFHYPLWHYFCYMKIRLSAVQSLVKTFFSKSFFCLNSNSPPPVRHGWDTFWVNPIIVIYLCLWRTEGFKFNSPVSNSKKLHGYDFNKVGCSNPALAQQTPGGESLETPKTCLKYVISKMFYHHHWSSRGYS